MKARRIILLTLAIMLAMSNAHASWTEVIGMTLLEVSTVSEKECPHFGQYDCDQWPDDFMEWGYGTKCVVPDYGWIGYIGYGQEALLFGKLIKADNGKEILFETIVLPDGTGSPTTFTPKWYRCPT